MLKSIAVLVANFSKMVKFKVAETIETYQEGIPKDAPNQMEKIILSAIGTEGQQISTPAGTTQYIDDAGVASSHARTVLDKLSLGPPKFDANDIAAFMRKPVILQQGVFTTAQARGTDLYSFSIATELIDNSMWIQKIRGYNLFRATANVRVTFNAMPFHQGRLILHFLPCVDGMGPVISQYGRMHNFDMCQITQHPCVELDVKDSSCQLLIPYMTPTSYLDLDAFRYDWGNVYLTVLSPLKSGPASPTSIEYTIFLNFEDVELSAPVYHAESNSSSSFKKGNNSNVVRRSKPSFVNNLDKEEQNASWLSSGLASLAKVSSALTMIPGAATIAGPVAGLLGSASNVAKAFGWAKPILTKESTVVLQHPFRHLGNYKGDVAADNLALDPTSKMEPMVGFAGAAVDEMSFAYLKQIPAFVGAFTVLSTDNSGTSVYSKQISPDGLGLETQQVGTAATNILRSYPPFAYIAQHCMMWRGSINVTFKFVKTDYHSSRLLVTFTPWDTPSVPTNEQSSYSLREIIDLRSISEITLNLPYLRPYNFLNIAANGNLDMLGQLEVRVLNELVVPETCSPSYEVLVYYSAGADFEVAGLGMGGLGHVPFYPQANTEPIGQSTYQSTGLEHNLASIGDPILSIKQLISAAQPLYSTDFTDADPIIGLYPFCMMLYSGNVNVDELLVNPILGGDILPRFAHGYVFMRGSVRVTIVPQTQSGYSYARLSPLTGESYNAVTVPETPYFQTPYPDVATNRPGTVAIIACRNNESGAIDVLVPHMCATDLKLIRPFYSVQTVFGSQPDESRYHLYTARPSGTPVQTMFRSAGDDFSLGYFIGFPPLCFAYTTVP